MDRSVAREIAKYGINVGDTVTVQTGMYAGERGVVARIARAAGFVAAIVKLDKGIVAGAGLYDLVKA
ncbi:MAG: hypothetical protein ACM30G_04435 [Micromonosporaceae bacterium]